MKKSIRIILFLICLSFSVRAQEKPVQRQIVFFPQIGGVEITTWEKDKDVPRIVFRYAKTGKLIREISYSDKSSDVENFVIDKSREFGNPTIHFRVLNTKQIPSPIIFVTGVMYGGSDGSLITYLVSDVGGKLEVLNTSPLVSSYQGGTFVGYLGRKYGFGAVVWNFIWQDGFAHYADHPYNIEIYSFNSATKRFSLRRHLTTKKLYYYGTNPIGPLREFGISGRDMLETLPRLGDRREW